MGRLLNAKEADQFRQMVADYQTDGAVLRKFQDSNFVVIAGPAGAGKDTLRNSLISMYPELYLPILSTTSRPPRPGETDGQTYHFRSVEQIKQGFKCREYFQTALVHDQQVSCMHIDEVNKLNSKQYGLSILITSTEAELRAHHSGIKTIFVTPPDRRTLLDRINAQRMLDNSEIERRLQAARVELTFALESPRYYCLVSDTVSHIRNSAHNYLHKGVFDPLEDIRGREAICQILKSID